MCNFMGKSTQKGIKLEKKRAKERWKGRKNGQKRETIRAKRRKDKTEIGKGRTRKE